jgi:hypothetical protein
MDRCWSLLKVRKTPPIENIRRTIPDLDLDARVSFRNILDASYDLRHLCDARLFRRL